MITITRHQAELWGGLAMAALGALVLLMIIMSMVTGLCYRLFMITSGRAVVRRKRRPMVLATRADGERVPLATLLDGGAGKDTEDLPVVTLDG